MKKDKKYIGLTLIFAYRKKDGLEAEKISFLMRDEVLHNIRRDAERIGHKQETRSNRGKYMGIYDIFEINGPLKTGAIMGRTTLWSYKDIASAKKLIKPKEQFAIYVSKRPTADKRYIADAVYVLGISGKQNRQRILICYILLKSQSKKTVFKDAIAIARSRQLKMKIESILLQDDPSVPNGLKFIGFGDICPVPEKIAIGNFFERAYRKFNKLSSIRKLVMTDKQISAKIKLLVEERDAVVKLRALSKEINRYINLDQWNKARCFINAALKINPKDHWFLSRLALTYYEQYDYKKSLVISRQALRIAPKCSMVLWDYACSLEMLGHTRNALKIYNGLVRRGSSSIAYGECGEGIRLARSIVNDCLYRMAKCYTNIGNKPKALKLYKEYIKNRERGTWSIYLLKDARLKFQALKDEVRRKEISKSKRRKK
ncbi:MAG: tetratricopeptide repeat protein [Candidatus Omnitrophica bacterium]|nr:tetratricopeptide repeat protein [Candidatus Omnitrophota bacterium]